MKSPFRQLALTALAALVILPSAFGQELPASFGAALKAEKVFAGKPEYRKRPITVEARVKFETSDSFNIIVASDAKSSGEHWELYTFMGQGDLCIYQPGYGGEVRSDFPICDGQWHNVAAFIGENSVKLYVDGNKVAEQDTTPGDTHPAPGGLAIGGLVEGGYPLVGEIDDVRISRGERKIEVSPDPLKTDSQTLGLWNFDTAP